MTDKTELIALKGEITYYKEGIESIQSEYNLYEEIYGKSIYNTLKRLEILEKVLEL